jgi:hypothetical protein
MIIRHDVDPSLYIAAPDQFPAVVVVDGHYEAIAIPYDNIDRLLKPSLLPTIQTEPQQLLCSDGMATLIRPDWLLTTAQVAQQLSLESVVNIAQVAYPIQQIVIHPHFRAEPATSLNPSHCEQVAHDIALLQLQRPVQGVTPVPLYGDSDEQQKMVTLAGWGDFGTGLIGPDCVDKQLRVATNQVEKADEQWLMMRFDAPPAGTLYEGIAGPGDSGGPALVSISAQDSEGLAHSQQGFAIAGIRSGQDSGGAAQSLGEGYYGVWDYYTRVSCYFDWITTATQS